MNGLSHCVIGLCIERHRELGRGLLGSVYEEALAFELSGAGLQYERQQDESSVFQGVTMDGAYPLDFDLEGTLVRELKAVEGVWPAHHGQLLSHLKLVRRRQRRLGNFNVPVFTSGIRRVETGERFNTE